MDYIIGALMAIGILFLISFTHEAGHYGALVAFGIPVKEFSIGFGPVLYQEKDKTTTSLRLFPAISYVDFNLQDISHLPPVKKIIIFVAGPIVNIVLGIICFIVIPDATRVLWDILLRNSSHIILGPVTFVFLITRIIQKGWWRVVVLLGFLSFATGLLNLAPLPALDGRWALGVLRNESLEKIEISATKSIKLITLATLVLGLIDITLVITTGL